MLAGTATMVAVLAVAWWMFRPAAPAVDSTLPMAGSVTPAGSATPVGIDDNGATAANGVTTATVVVHVTGQVSASGVVRLPEGARVVDAVAAAGGATPAAALQSLNLAAVLSDGQQVHVPAFGEAVAPTTLVGGSEPSGFPVDLNVADAGALDTLPGVGPATAAAIVRWRDENGPFASIDELLDVPGLGPAKVEALRGLVIVG